MKCYLAGLCIAAVSVAATPQLLNVPLDLVPEYSKLLDMCNNGPPNTVLAFRYGTNVYKTYVFGDCFPSVIDGDSVELALFCKATTCQVYPTPSNDCTAGLVTVPLLGVPGLPVVNPAGSLSSLFASARCRSGLLN